MKTKIDKSQLFKMAWSMYKRSISVLGREFCQSFSACLRNAWFKMKAEARKAEKEARRLMKKSGPAQKPESIVFDSAMERGIIEYYRNQSGRYCGDWYTKYTCSSKTTRAVDRSRGKQKPVHFNKNQYIKPIVRDTPFHSYFISSYQKLNSWLWVK